MGGTFGDHETHEPVETRRAVEDLVEDAAAATDRDLSSVFRILAQPTESVRQLEVWRATGSAVEVARDVAARTRISAGVS